MTDQVNDDRGTRFGDLSVLETAKIGSQVFVAAGGADDGISLMTLLPGGRLLHLDTLAEDGTMALRDPAALALAGAGTALELFVAGDLAPGTTDGGMGITRLAADLGSIGMRARAGAAGGTLAGTAGRDQLAGGAGDDVLRGGAGDDILQGGAGTDTLWGGAGADVFVIAGDGWPDTIADFEPGIDRMYLSGLGRFYTLDALAISPERGGAQISIGGETVLVQTADGSRLTPDQLSLGDVRGLWHVSSAPLPATGRRLEGGDGADLLDGRAGGDTLVGGAGGDILQGQDGNDWLTGDGTNPGFDTVSAQVHRLYRATLDRDPDTHGLFHWAGLVQSGARSLTAVAQGFVDAPEFLATYGATDSTGFVTLLYRNVLGREPDAGGLAHWVTQLDGGRMSRAQVVVGFSESPEFVDASAAGAAAVSHAALQGAATGDVYRLYLGVLDREPDLAGFEGWTARLASGTAYETVVAGFVGAPEFVTRFDVPDSRAFVTLLYNNVLGRAPDAAGLDHWVAQIDGGARSRPQVVTLFVSSPEYVAATEAACARWVLAAGQGDTLDGGPGDNVLVGGILADRFVLHAGEASHHTLVDVEVWDTVVFDGFGYADPYDLQARLIQQGDDVLFADQGVTALFLDADVQEIAYAALLV